MGSQAWWLQIATFNLPAVVLNVTSKMKNRNSCIITTLVRVK